MRAINFSAGPAGLPLPALERARDELLDFAGSGMSIMEQSHRGAVYEKVHHETVERLSRLLELPATHTVLFVSGGASQQFGVLPMNFLTPGKSADYVVAGVWGEKALEEAKRVGQARASWQEKGADGRYVRVPRPDEIKTDPAAVYVHTTSNNTVFGTQFPKIPDFGALPHICDMSSDFLSRRVDMGRFVFAYAGAQKNLGPSGLVVAIAQKAFLEAARKDLPKILRYQTHAENDSLYNTPNTFGIYLARNVLAWLEDHGGVAWMEKRNREKAELIYSALDRLSGFYRAPVERDSRSQMNVVFRLPSVPLEERFVAEAEQQHMIGLKGHRSVGGIRASLYNAVSPDDVRTLVSFMEAFAKKNG